MKVKHKRRKRKYSFWPFFGQIFHDCFISVAPIHTAVNAYEAKGQQMTKSPENTK